MRKMALYILLATIFASCTKEDLVRPHFSSFYIKDSIKRILPDPSTLGLDSFYFRGTIHGKTVSWIVADYTNGLNLPFRYNNAAVAAKLGNDCVYTFCHSAIADGIIHQNNKGACMRNYIAVGFNIASKTGNTAEAASWFLPGKKPFGKPRTTISDPVKDGVYIYYIDSDNKEWSTAFGKGRQAGSYFRSISLTDENRPQVHSQKKWKADFSCTLYDKSGHSLTIVNGEIYVPVFPVY